jgi:anthranilate phosphoribosyltransferase
MLKPYIKKTAENINLTEKEAEEAMQIIMTGQASDIQIASFISIMRMKKETIEEITGFAKVMRQNSVKVKLPLDKPAIDTCGTGGDGSNTFNISTVSAFVVSGAGVIVAKHGNRAVSSKCGSADLLRELGVNIDIPVEKVEECLDTIGIGFLFAPNMHPAMKYAIGPRREIGIRTFFNILGPLTNPAGVQRQVIGLYSSDILKTVTEVLKNMGSKKAMVINSKDGLDEISVSADTDVCELEENGNIKTYTINPCDFGLNKADISEIKGGDETENARIALEVLSGDKGAVRDVVILNAGAGIYTSGIAETLEQGVQMAIDSIDSGKAKDKLDKLIELTGKGEKE